MDGWFADSTSSLQNSTAIADDGSHSLKMTINNATSDEYPVVYTDIWDGPAPMPDAGQKITASVYVPRGVAPVQAEIFIEDTNAQQIPVSFGEPAPLKQGAWNRLSLTIPSNIVGSIAEYGIIFHLGSTSPQTLIVYIDAINWS
jgi:hypothetical protein